MFNSIRFKITVLFTVVLGVILLAFSSYLYFNVSTFIYYEVDKALTQKVEAIEAIIEEYASYLEPDSDVTPESLERVIELIANPRREFFQAPTIKDLDQKWTFKIHELGLKSDFIVIYYPSGDVAINSTNIVGDILEEMQTSFKGVPHERLFIQDVISGDLKFRIITKPFDRFGQVRYVLQLATSMDAVLFRIKKRFSLIFIAIPIVLITMSILGWIYVVKILQPISDIRRAAEAITHKDMSKRVPQTLADEEIVALVNSFNSMIERLEKSFQYIQEFSYDVAHELRTPLAIIRGEAEVALRRDDRSAEEYKSALEACLEETESMRKMVEDLLLLTKLESQPQAITLTHIDLSDFMRDFYEQVKILAKNKQLMLSLKLPKVSKNVNANTLHLRRLFFNLVDNAIKFTAEKGKIDIAVTYENRHARVSIADNGIGISQEDLPKLMKRFFHRESTEIGAEAGHGLGLSLVHYIAKVHQGRIEVQSKKGVGSTFSVILPVV